MRQKEYRLNYGYCAQESHSFSHDSLDSPGCQSYASQLRFRSCVLFRALGSPPEKFAV